VGSIRQRAEENKKRFSFVEPKRESWARNEREVGGQRTFVL
jgi:hypothetical protein